MGFSNKWLKLNARTYNVSVIKSKIFKIFQFLLITGKFKPESLPNDMPQGANQFRLMLYGTPAKQIISAMKGEPNEKMKELKVEINLEYRK